MIPLYRNTSVHHQGDVNMLTYWQKKGFAYFIAGGTVRVISDLCFSAFKISGIWYPGNAISHVLFWMAARAIFRNCGKYIVWVNVFFGASLNAFIDETFFDPTAFGWNEKLFAVVLFLYILHAYFPKIFKFKMSDKQTLFSWLADNLQDVWAWLVKTGAWIGWTFIGLVGKWSYAYTSGKRLKFWEYAASAGVALYIGYLTSVFCEQNFPEKSKYLVPMAVVASDKLMALIMSIDWGQLIEKMLFFIKPKKDK